MKTILYTGSRDWADPVPVKESLIRFKKLGFTRMVHGDARGLDRIAGELATELGYDVHAYPADWYRYGKGAGPQRNASMCTKERPHTVVGFHEHYATSRGTGHMCAYACSRTYVQEVYLFEPLIGWRTLKRTPVPQEELPF